MKITNEVRELEAHVKSLSTDKAEQIAIISKAQGMAAQSGNEYGIAVLSVVKNRIRKS